MKRCNHSFALAYNKTLRLECLVQLYTLALVPLVVLPHELSLARHNFFFAHGHGKFTLSQSIVLFVGLLAKQVF